MQLELRKIFYNSTTSKNVMIKLHGIDGTEILLSDEKIVAITKGCHKDCYTQIVIDALCETKSGGCVNMSYFVLEMSDEIEGLMKGLITQEVVDKKYQERFEMIKKEQNDRCPF